MMDILIRLDEPVWRMAGKREVAVGLAGTDLTVADVIRELGIRFPGMDAELRGQTGDMVPYSLFLNDNSVRWTEIENVRVKQGDRMRVILPIAGG